MVFYEGNGSNKLAVVVDVRSEHDRDSRSVLQDWALGKRALGRNQWAATLKLALREHGSEPWNAARVKEEASWICEKLRQRGIEVIVPVQTRAIPGERQVHSAWNMFGAPGNPYKWAGTAQLIGNQYVCPILHPANYEYVYGWLLERWIRQALALAKGMLAPMPWPDSVWMPGKDMHLRLLGMALRGAPLAVDIETSMDGSIITAIGFANELGAVSVPWHSFNIAGTNGEREPGILDYGGAGSAIAGSVRDILEDASIHKIMHNGTFDVVQLRKHGIEINGFAHDTLLMHRVAYPQYRHGLQQACATEFLVEPWKCLFKPPKIKEGDPWLGCPVELRKYNCKDSYATYQLWKHLEGKLG